MSVNDENRCVREGLFLREPLLEFAQAMEKTLRIHDEEKGGERGWSQETARWLFTRLQEEVAELEEAIDNVTPAQAMLECTNVANFAMMIHDNICRLNPLAAPLYDGDEDER